MSNIKNDKYLSNSIAKSELIGVQGFQPDQKTQNVKSFWKAGKLDNASKAPSTHSATTSYSQHI